MGPSTIPQLEALVGRLPITAENFGTFWSLLQLPYDVFRPIVDLMLAGVAFPEDLRDGQQNWLAGALKLADGDLARSALAAAGPLATADGLAAALVALAHGGRPGAAVLPRDQTAVGIGPNGEYVPSYAPASQEVYSYDSSLVCPNAIEVLRGGGPAGGAKLAARSFAAAMNPEVF